MNSITENLNHIHSSINSAVTNSKREENSVKLLCVSKTKPKRWLLKLTMLVKDTLVNHMP